MNALTVGYALNENSMNVSVRDILDREEGYREEIYLDIYGIPTGGHGHAFQVGSRLPRKIWETIFNYDIHTARQQFNKLNLHHLSPTRQSVCISMIYQLGFDGFSGFKLMLCALRAGDYVTAAAEMLDSLWYKRDTPARAKRMHELMLSG